MLSFHRAVEEEFSAVNEMIVSQLQSDVGLVENIGQYIVESGGKRLRPVVVLLSALANGYKWLRAYSAWLRLSNLFTRRRCCTTTLSMSRRCAAAVRQPMLSGATPPVCWSATSFIHARSKCWWLVGRHANHGR